MKHKRTVEPAKFSRSNSIHHTRASFAVTLGWRIVSKRNLKVN